jgi:hypothetical protein
VAKMKKIILIEFVIIVLTIVVVLPLVLTAHSSFAGYQSINQNNASRALIFNLKTGQTVTGSITSYGDVNGQWYLVVDPNNNEINSNVGSLGGEGNYGTFTFTANIDGEWYISMDELSPFGSRFDYSYSISAAPTLGINRTELIVIVIILGIVSGLITAVWHTYSNSKKGKETNLERQHWY